MDRIRSLAWRYRDRLNPQDQLFLSLRLGSRYPEDDAVDRADRGRGARGADDPRERGRLVLPRRLLFHFGRLSDIPEPEVRARQAFEQAFQRDSLYGGPIQHLAALTWAARDTAAQRLWTRRLIALDSAGEGVPGARWNLLQATRDTAGIRAFLAGLDAGPWCRYRRASCSSVRSTASRSPIAMLCTTPRTGCPLRSRSARRWPATAQERSSTSAGPPRRRSGSIPWRR